MTQKVFPSDFIHQLTTFFANPLAEIYKSNPIFLKRGWHPRVIAVGTIPVQLLNPARVVVCTISNTSASISGLLPPIESSWNAPVVANASGNNQANFLDIFSYLYLTLFLSVTAVTGSWSFFLQEQNPTSGLWADTGLLWTGVNAVEQLAFPVQTRWGHRQAVRWVMDAAGQITFQLSYNAKSYIGGSLTGVNQTLYMGPTPDVSINTGFELQGGDSLTLICDENTQIWGVAQTNIQVDVLEWF
jgi:hypothetical protein